MTHECKYEEAGDVDTQETKQMMANLDSCVMHPSESLSWDSIVGNEMAKKALEEAILLPDRYAEILKENNLKAWNGILLCGVPGCGKTELAYTAASIAKAPFYVVRASDLKSMWTGRSERYVKLLFKKAREHPVSVIFFDEIDSLAQKRASASNQGGDGILTELLNEMNFKANDKVSRIVVIAATNVPSTLDSGIIRRFQKTIHVKMPESQDRSNIFRVKIETSMLRVTLSDKDFLHIGRATEG
jgi:SpoVK/Ycf46/Vps4 family AAA+-type ATPase